MGISEDATHQLQAVTTFPELAALVKRLVRAQGKTLRELEKSTGVSRATFSSVLNSKRPPSHTVMSGLVAALEVPAADRPLWMEAWGRLTAAADGGANAEDAHRVAQQLQEALDAERRRYQETVQDIAARQHRLAQALSAIDDRAAARDLHRLTYELCRQYLGLHNRHTLSALDGLTFVLDKNREHDLSVVTLHTALEELGSLASGDPIGLAVRAMLGRTLFDRGDLVAARTHQEQIYEQRRRDLGGKHPDTQRALQALIRTVHEQRDIATARALQQRLEGSPPDQPSN
ncbi:helix-turn-helix domain-containing protein [Dactylosporangium matsuzakiense]|uniref:HTH cro/C1-type domain-containing protein n=1 Tax=Dactylosporangium matsuzakiense TaxID=53360 RepID=A0A9W6KJM1_9ACTN|nr:helix-turn-helix transcriptional regulator [Dactylosporangium matsuzakiense]UWZ43904.1 helix-turn-helix transcriptional regulator [Dactylosporangium matsuzakiense]GLL03256.1 hypothetical protein GCM10017581_050000 [Dactylosporangium matsuzakiense]